MYSASKLLSELLSSCCSELLSSCLSALFFFNAFCNLAFNLRVLFFSCNAAISSFCTEFFAIYSTNWYRLSALVFSISANAFCNLAFNMFVFATRVLFCSCNAAISSFSTEFFAIFVPDAPAVMRLICCNSSLGLNSSSFVIVILRKTAGDNCIIIGERKS